MALYGTYANRGDIRSLLDYSAADTTDNVRLRHVLEAVSRHIDRHCRKHFSVRSETRYFDGKAGTGRVIDQYTQQVAEYTSQLWVDELLSITTLKMDSDGDAVYEDVLATTDYILWPWNEWPKARIDLDFRQGDYSYWVQGQQRIELAGMWGYGDGESATPYTDSGATVTVADATGTTIVASAGTSFKVAQTVLAGTEQFYITEIATNDLTAVRGVNGTTAAAHTDAATYIYQYPALVREACLIQTMRIFKRKDAPFGVAGSVEMGVIKVLSKLDPDVKTMLEFFTRSPYLGAV